MDVSFQPNGKWFVFDTITGETLAKDFRTKAGAVVWMTNQAEKILQAAREAPK